MQYGINYITEQIKSRIPLTEAVELYTGERFKRNKMRCPLHSEKTASFTVYPENNSFYCFGCGTSGSVINFVMQYFNLDFKAALHKIDADFCLGLFEPLTLSEYRRMKKAAAQRQAERRKRQEWETALDNNYWKAFDRVLEYERNMEIFAPSSPEQEPHPLFISALQNIEYARHLLDCAENERRMFEIGRNKPV